MGEYVYFEGSPRPCILHRKRHPFRRECADASQKFRLKSEYPLCSPQNDEEYITHYKKLVEQEKTARQFRENKDDLP